MTSDQWFTFAISALGVAGVLGGFIVGAYISRKARAATRAYRTEQDDPEAIWLTVGLAIALLCVGTVLVLLWAYYSALRGDVQAACGQDSVVARLDLSEWVKPCLAVR